MENVACTLVFSYCEGLGPLYFNELMNRFNSPIEAYNASVHELRKVLGPVTLAKFIKVRKTIDPIAELEKLRKQDITVLTRDDSRYPYDLSHFKDAPICLYVKGDLKDVDFNSTLIGVVGTRNPSSYGETATRDFTKALVEHGCTIVSGMALGIDGLAHRTALENKGKTIAVLGSGVNVVYPNRNLDIYKQIVNGGGLIISEFPPNHPALKGMFVARNRIIAGISKGVLITEGRINSGALKTGRFAAEQGHDVFVIPGSIYAQRSDGPNSLLLEGARPVLDPKDILDVYGITGVRKKIKARHDYLTEEEINLVNILEKEALTIDELCILSGKLVHQILSIIGKLEYKGAVQRNKEGTFQLK